MGKISQEQRSRFFEKVKENRKLVDGRIAKEKTLQDLLAQDPSAAGYKRLTLAEEALNVASYWMLLSNVSTSLLGIKNEDFLADARKAIARAIKQLEDTVTAFIDAPFSDYEEKLAEIADFDPDARYRLLRKFGFAIRSLEDAYGSSKWKWSFVELWGKYATVAKNLLDLKNLQANLDFSSQYRESSMNHLSLVKRQFQQAADRYREKYEIYSNKAEDFRTAILFLSALRRLNALLGERDDVEELKRKIEIWNAKLEGDIKKREERKER